MRYLLATILLAGCSGHSGNNGGDGGVPDLSAGGGGDMAGLTTERLIAANYTLPPGEVYECARVTATKDYLIHVVIPVNGLSTHHEVVGIDPKKAMPDTDPNAANPPTCNGLEVMNWNLIFADGVGSPSLTMPDGVVMKVSAGDQIVLQLHLLNASTSPVTSMAAVDVQTLDPSLVKNEAEMILAGPVQFQIPPGTNQMINGKCTMNGATNYYAVFPHMHKLGTHITVNAVVGGASQQVYDGAWDFNNQLFQSFTPIAMAQGDTITVACTYDNNTGGNVSFGTSTTDEMCFAISYRYPKLPAKLGGSICPY
jgi:hypothetical protein